MNFESFKNKAFELALAKGCEAAEIFLRDAEELSVEVLDEKVDSHNFSHTAGACLRVKLDGHDGYFYTELFEDPENAVRRAMDNAAVMEACDHPMNGACEYPELPETDDTADRVSAGDMISLALDAEQHAKKADTRVVRMDYNTVVSARQTTLISNTRGLNATYDSSLFASVLVPIAQSGEELRDASAFSAGASSLNTRALAERAVGFAVAKFGAAPVPSGDYKIILQSRAAAELLSAFSPQFCADMVQKGLSPLDGCEGTQIAAPCVNITDDPLFSYSPRPFDYEGTPSRVTDVVRKGRLVSLLHNLKTAKKAGCISTSNAGRASAASPIDVACSNFILQAGDRTLDSMLADMGDGLLICELSGLHAGAQSMTGHFSLLAGGFLVDGGKITRPIERITAAGNFGQLLRDIEALGDDLFLTMPSDSVYGAPSLYIPRGIKISGT